MEQLQFVLTLLAAIGSGIMSGLFFVFSNFAMKAFASLPRGQGAAAMQQINIMIINPLFVILFMGTAVCSFAVAALALLDWQRLGTIWLLIGAGLYLGGCIVITGARNVPLNNQLAAISADDPNIESEWQYYLAKWLPWNHVRSVTTALATIAFIMASRLA